MTSSPASARILEALNPPQREAVRHASGPLLVVAGPGSGKTRVITHRIAHLVHTGVAPGAILAITFTNKAAAEMRQRVEDLLDVRVPWISTFHSFAARILRRHIHRLPPFTTSFTIYDADDTLALVKECARELDISTSLLPARALRSEVSRLKNRGIEDPDAIPPTARFEERLVRNLFARYVKALEARNALDFDDLLLFLVRLFKTQPDILEYYRDTFRFVLVDEYQDTNQVQYRIGSLIAGGHRNICVTGDPDQSIYSWRGADIGNILSFERDYPDATVVKLEQNYRSTRRILAVANAVIEFNEQRKPKELWTENATGDPARIYCFRDSEEEAAEVAGLIAQFLDEGVRADEIAVFYRINALSRELEQALILRGIPYGIVGAVEFFARREIKDLLAYLRIAVNPRDAESLRRIINVPARGIGKTTMAKILDAAAALDVPALDVVMRPDLRPPVSRRIGRALDGFAELVTTISGGLGAPVAELLDRVYTASGYRKHLETLDEEEGSDRMANVAELINAAAQYDERQAEGSVEGFLEEIALYSPLDRWEPQADRVTLMTLHSAKGLEFPIVIICGVEEGILPLQRQDELDGNELEEERRLLFVGVTRAREKLYLTHAENRMRFGRLKSATPSSFLSELVEAVPEDAVEVDDETVRALRSSRALADAFDWDTAAASDAGSLWDEGETSVADLGTDVDELDLDEDPYPPGTRVYHEQFGAGVVVAGRGRGRLRRLTVRFDEAGKKQIAIGFATLHRME